MNYRNLKPDFVRFLDRENAEGGTNWPKYRYLKSYARDHDFAFSEREYDRLRKLHIAAEGIVVAMVHSFHESLSADLRDEFPELLPERPDQWVEQLTEFSNGKQARSRDYYRGGTWRDLRSLLLLPDFSGEHASFCRTEDLARRVMEAQFIETGRDLVPQRDRNSLSLVMNAAEERSGRKAESCIEFIVNCWRAVPECVWLTTKRGKPIGGSIVLPLSEDAYNKLKSGLVSELELSPENDIHLPSRHLWVYAMATFPEVPKSRMPGVHTSRQLFKLCQQGAVLIGDENPDPTSVQFISDIGSPKLEKSVMQLGYRPLGYPIHKSKFPLYELIIPPPEKSIADFSSAAATLATLVGTCWRLLPRGQCRNTEIAHHEGWPGRFGFAKAPVFPCWKTGASTK